MHEEIISAECGNCGKTVSKDAKKCPYCGVSFHGVKRKYVQGEPRSPYDEEVNAIFEIINLKSVGLTLAIDLIIIFLIISVMGSELWFAVIMCLVLDCLILPISYILTN